MSDYFRIIRGLDIDERMRIIQGAGAPGLTSDTDAAPVGSIYADTTTGDLYTKRIAGPGPVTWAVSAGSGSPTLFDEVAVAPTPPAASGVNSIALGAGAATSTAATNSLAIGSQSLTRLPGSVALASGRFGSSGDAQVCEYLLRTITVNGATTEAFMDGTNGSQRLTLPDNSTWTFTAVATGHRTDGPGHAGYEIKGVIYRDSGASTVGIQGAVTKTIIAESDAAWDINITADTTNGSLKIVAKGEPGKIVRWLVHIKTVEVTN